LTFVGPSFRDAAWILLGTLLGMAVCVLVRGVLAPVSAAPMASLTVFALLLGSLSGPDRTARLRI
jgi:hypothetical protein